MSTGKIILILGDKEEEVKWKEESIFNKLSHLGLTLDRFRNSIGKTNGRAAQVKTKSCLRGISI